MNLEEFIATITEESPPPGLNPLLLALWYDGKGDWEMSHNITQDIDTPEAAQIHAYLHRKEGDSWNADYWYARAGIKRTKNTLEEEWASLVERLIKQVNMH